MATTHVTTLEGEQIRFNNDTWELTGEIAFKQNGSVVEATARKPDRVRGSRGTLRFQLSNPPSSINPGNPDSFDAELDRENGTALVLTRPHASNRYALESLRYE